MDAGEGEIREPRLPWLVSLWCWLWRLRGKGRALTLYEIELESLTTELRQELLEARTEADALEARMLRSEIEWDLERRRLEAAKDASIAEVGFLTDVLERNQKWVQADTAAHIASAEISGQSALRRRDS